jgi:predicted ATP-grasp superfamily ATP-dependent carboligase
MAIVVVVDGYYGGRYYAKCFAAQNLKCVHVQSTKNLPEILTSDLNTKEYLKTFIHSNLEQTISEINQVGKPIIIVPGSDTGIILADKIASFYQLNTANDVSISLARRDKFLMGEEVRNNGIRMIRQTKAKSASLAIEWIKKEKLHYPIVIKPLKSAAGEGFTLCKNERDVEKSFALYLNKPDLFNHLNKEMLVQEYIRGPEYAVNSVSCNGYHKVSEICRYSKIITEEGHSLYVSIDFLPLNIPEAEVLSNYLFKVLSALKVRYGPSHTEIFLDEKGPVLCEVGCRPMGPAASPAVLNEIYGHNQFDLSVIAYTHPEDLITAAKNLTRSIKHHYSFAFMYNKKIGTFIKLNDTKVKLLPSFKTLEMCIKSGKLIKEPRHVDDSICIVHLKHSDAKVIQADIKQLRILEQDDSVIEIYP